MANMGHSAIWKLLIIQWAFVLLQIMKAIAGCFGTVNSPTIAAAVIIQSIINLLSSSYRRLDVAAFPIVQQLDRCLG